VISLDVSTIDGVSRNRMSAPSIEMLRQLLEYNNFIQDLNLSSTGLGNAGLDAICEVLQKGAQKASSHKLL
jgi:hypothetical protein